MSGPPPKRPEQRRRRNADPIERKQLSEPPPEYPPLTGTHRSETFAWFETWATSPQAARFIATDWQRLQMVAFLVDAFFAEPDKALMAEIRINEAALGATEADRLRLRWDVEPPKQPEAKPTTSARRAHLTLLSGAAS